jgi:hypothetical protein
MLDFPGGPFGKSNGLDSTRQGPFGRAVRKLTPRKGSLVNLLKGRGWSRPEDLGSVNGLGEGDLTFGLSQDLTMTGIRDIQGRTE